MSLTITEDLTTRQELNQLLSGRILVLDGATGTGLESLRPSADDFGGDKFFGCNELLNRYAPHIVLTLHRSYLEAGSDVILTNSFNGSPIVLQEYGIAGE